jgi:D-alanyl-D-alanine carboxypeptidase
LPPSWRKWTTWLVPWGWPRRASPLPTAWTRATPFPPPARWTWPCWVFTACRTRLSATSFPRRAAALRCSPRPRAGRCMIFPTTTSSWALPAWTASRREPPAPPAPACCSAWRATPSPAAAPRRGRRWFTRSAWLLWCSALRTAIPWPSRWWPPAGGCGKTGRLPAWTWRIPRSLSSFPWNLVQKRD